MTSPAQPTDRPNHVLVLDGTDSYVQLPPDIFNNLTEATVEGWVKWSSFGHRRLNGGVERIIQKGATSQSEALEMVRSVMQNCAPETP